MAKSREAAQTCCAKTTTDPCVPCVQSRLSRILGGLRHLRISDDRQEFSFAYSLPWHGLVPSPMLASASMSRFSSIGLCLSLASGLILDSLPHPVYNAFMQTSHIAPEGVECFLLISWRGLTFVCPLRLRTELAILVEHLPQIDVLNLPAVEVLKNPFWRLMANFRLNQDGR